jgi:DNA-binding transcriptional MerR regulator
VSEVGSYTIGELAKLAGVTTRTVRYYIAEGLLPPPVSGGQADRYDDDHLRRLELIRGLKAEYLPLAEIRARLQTLDRQAVQELVAQTAAGAPSPTHLAEQHTAQDYLRALLHPAREGALRSAVERRAQAGPGAPLGPPAAGGSAGLDGAPPAQAPRPSTPAPAPSQPVQSAPAHAARREAPPEASAWVRYALHPDIELHVRQPAQDARLRARLAALVRALEETVRTYIVQNQEDPHD